MVVDNCTSVDAAVSTCKHIYSVLLGHRPKGVLLLTKNRDQMGSLFKVLVFKYAGVDSVNNLLAFTILPRSVTGGKGCILTLTLLHDLRCPYRFPSHGDSLWNLLIYLYRQVIDIFEIYVPLTCYWCLKNNSCSKNLHHAFLQKTALVVVLPTSPKNTWFAEECRPERLTLKHRHICWSWCLWIFLPLGGAECVPSAYGRPLDTV